MSTLPWVDRDFPEWHGGCEHAMVWTLEVDCAQVRAEVAATRDLLGSLLLPRYERQPHITVAFGGLVPRAGARPADHIYSTAELRADLTRLAALQTSPLCVRIPARDTFSTAPYLAVDCEALMPLHRALTVGRPSGIAYTPHVTVGHYGVAVPIAEVERRFGLAPAPSLSLRVSELTLARYETRDIAGALTPVGRFALDTGAWQPVCSPEGQHRRNHEERELGHLDQRTERVAGPAAEPAAHVTPPPGSDHGGHHHRHGEHQEPTEATRQPAHP